jgi:tRNA threonylcarbamoyladenosine modification (KEOPS) complex Cgi121 subunit
MFEIMDFCVIVSSTKISTALTKSRIDNLITKLLTQEKKFKPKSAILFIDTGAVAGIHHLYACILNSLKGFAQKNNISKSLNVEILLYLSGYRQISKAIERCGLSKTTRDILCVQITKNQHIKDKSNYMFDFRQFFSENKITTKDFRKDIESFCVVEPKIIMKNLEITDEDIDAVIGNNKNKTSREHALEFLAIEKSALLNLIK